MRTCGIQRQCLQKQRISLRKSRDGWRLRKSREKDAMLSLRSGNVIKIAFSRTMAVRRWEIPQDQRRSDERNRQARTERTNLHANTRIAGAIGKKMYIVKPLEQAAAMHILRYGS